jgi:hypothetical protein
MLDKNPRILQYSVSLSFFFLSFFRLLYGIISLGTPGEPQAFSRGALFVACFRLFEECSDRLIVPHLLKQRLVLCLPVYLSALAGKFLFCCKNAFRNQPSGPRGSRSCAIPYGDFVFRGFGSRGGVTCRFTRKLPRGCS